MHTPFTNYGLFHRRGPQRQKDVDPALIPALRREAIHRKNADRLSRRAILIIALASIAICAMISVIIFVIRTG
jgi:hypothetical protein